MSHSDGTPDHDELQHKALTLLEQAAAAPSDADAAHVDALAGIGYALLALDETLDTMRRAAP